jgi:hypothetical protein
MEDVNKRRPRTAEIGWNVLALGLFWLLTWAIARVGSYVWHDTAPLISTGHIVAGLVALFLAVRFRATVATVVIAGMDLYLAVEFLFHSIYGYEAVQSGPTHLAVLTAAIAGMLLGTFAMPRLTLMRSHMA